MKNITETNKKVVLSSLWLVLIINMMYNDIFSIYIEVSTSGTFDAIPGEVTTVMAMAAIVTNIPIMMILCSRILTYKLNRKLNIVVGIFTILYVWGGMSSHPHYIVMAIIESILALTIIRIAWSWKKETA
jgi:hypothetical protein